MLDNIDPIKLMVPISIILIIMMGISLLASKYGNRILKNERSVANLKRINSIVIGVLIVSMIGMGCITYIKMMPSSEFAPTKKQGEDIITTSLGDEFILRYTTINFPDDSTSGEVYSTNMKFLGNFSIDGSYTRPNIIVQENSQNLRCYKMDEGLLIYSTNGQEFKGINKLHMTVIDDTTRNDPELINFARAMVSKKEWKWIEFFGKFLLECGDSEMKKDFERYALGEFTEEEINKYLEFEKKLIIDFSKQVLEESEK